MRSASSALALRREARLSTVALNSNLAALAAAFGSELPTIDVRADAYGHGAHFVVSEALAQGFHRFRFAAGAPLPAGVHPVDDRHESHELAAYGLDPAVGDHELRPVLTVVGEVVAVKRVPAGSAVSYGYSYRTSADSTLALVGLGYADGIPRLASNVCHVSIGGRRSIVAGRIAMDQLVVDVGDQQIALGDDAVLWGDTLAGAPSVQEWATATRRTTVELTAGLGRRIRRVVDR